MRVIGFPSRNTPTRHHRPI